MKRNNITFFMSLCSIFTLCLMIAILCSCCKTNTSVDVVAKSNNPKTVTDVEKANKATYMKAPTIKADSNGLITLAQCPEKDTHLKVDLSKEYDSATIYYDGVLIQTITDDNCLITDPGEKCPIHYMDANFDGFMDIFIGQGASRTYSCLLVWDNNDKKFHRIGTLGEPVLQNFMLHPSSKSVIEGGSNSWCNSSFTKSIWNGRQLVTQEELSIVTDPSQYAENGVTKKYTIKNVINGKVVSADEVSGLTDFWKPIAKIFGE